MKKILLLNIMLFLSLPALLSAASLPVPSAPPVSAKSYVIQDADSGYILAESGSDKRMEPASITKVMSAYIIFNEIQEGRLNLTDMVRISEKAWRMPGSRTFVEVGKQIPVEVLLKGIIIQSGNDATVALAEHVAGSEETFASLMTQQAQKLGMSDTNFVNSTGLPHKDHYSTGRDIAILTRTMINEHPEFYKYYSEKKFTYNGISQHNRNRLLWRDKTVDGVKTGHTESAGYCLVSSAKRKDMRLITIVLQDKSEEARATSSQALLNYGFRFFETRKLYSAGQALKKTRIWKGDSETLSLGLLEDLFVTIPRGKYKDLQATVDIPQQLIAPAKKAKQYGTLNISLDSKVITEKQLVALKSVKEGGLWQRTKDSVKLWFE